MPLIKYNGKLITRHGKLVKNKACCCNNSTCFGTHCTRIPSVLKLKLHDTNNLLHPIFGTNNSTTILCGDQCCFNALGGPQPQPLTCSPYLISNVCGPTECSVSAFLTIGWTAYFPDITPYPGAPAPYNTINRRRQIFVNLFLNYFMEQFPPDDPPYHAFIFVYFFAQDSFAAGTGAGLAPPSIPNTPFNQCGTLNYGFGKEILFTPKPTDCVNLLKNTGPFSYCYNPAVDPDLYVEIDNDE